MKVVNCKVTLLLVILAFYTKGITSEACDTQNPKASMCRPGTVFGQNITLDVSTAADDGHLNCSCFLVSNTSGLSLIFDAYPPAINCSARLNVLFDDKSLQVLCGAPVVPVTSTGTRATIIYTADEKIEVDSSYCLTFYGESAGAIMSLTCHEPPSNTNLTTSASATSKSASFSSSTQPTTTLPTRDSTALQTTTALSRTTKTLTSATSASTATSPSEITTNSTPHTLTEIVSTQTTLTPPTQPQTGSLSTSKASAETAIPTTSSLTTSFKSTSTTAPSNSTTLQPSQNTDSDGKTEIGTTAPNSFTESSSNPSNATALSSNLTANASFQNSSVTAFPTLSTQPSALTTNTASTSNTPTSQGEMSSTATVDPSVKLPTNSSTTSTPDLNQFNPQSTEIVTLLTPDHVLPNKTETPSQSTPFMTTGISNAQNQTDKIEMTTTTASFKNTTISTTTLTNSTEKSTNYTTNSAEFTTSSVNVTVNESTTHVSTDKTISTFTTDTPIQSTSVNTTVSSSTAIAVISSITQEKTTSLSTTSNSNTTGTSTFVTKYTTLTETTSSGKSSGVPNTTSSSLITKYTPTTTASVSINTNDTTGEFGNDTEKMPVSSTQPNNATTDANVNSTASSIRPTENTETKTTTGVPFTTNATILTQPSSTEIITNTTTTATSLTTTSITASETSTSSTSDNVTTAYERSTTIKETFVNETTVPTPTTTVEGKTSSGSFNTTNTTVTPENPDNITTTEPGPNNITTTTSINNDTSTVTDSSNTTADVGNTTTDRANQTTNPFFGDYDFQDYGGERSSSNIVVIVVPLLSVLLVGILGTFTFFVCKRLQRAKYEARQKSKEDTAPKKDQNLLQTGFLASSIQTREGQNTHKSPNQGAKAKYSTENETFKEVKGEVANNKTLTNGDTLKKDKPDVRKEALNQTLSDMPTLGGGTLGRTREYEPTERERELLDNLELNAIVLESDPSDSNRYFKKSDPGDWYRIIMKKKFPKDSSDTLKSTSGSLNATATSKASGKHKKHRSDKQRDETGKKKHRSGKDPLDAIYNEMTSSMKTSDRKRKRRHHTKHDEVDGSNPPPPVAQPRVIVSKPVATAETSAKLHEKLSQNKHSPSKQTPSKSQTPLRNGVPTIQANNGVAGIGASTVKSKPIIQPIKRPDIVPPLNLKTKDDDGSDTFTSVV